LGWQPTALNARGLEHACTAPRQGEESKKKTMFDFLPKDEYSGGIFFYILIFEFSTFNVKLRCNHVALRNKFSLIHFDFLRIS
jgi:hypothetical protein